jgi:IS30 family transposase
VKQDSDVSVLVTKPKTEETVMSYKHLSLEERHYLELELKAGTSCNKIAKKLNRHKSTLSREIARNTGQRGYRNKQANGLAQKRLKEKPKAVKLTVELKAYINKGLEMDWSPEQIVGRLKDDMSVSLHHESIYQYILKDKQSGGELYKNLRHQGKPYRKRYGNQHSRNGIPNRVDIDQRPEAANKRERVGDWELDTIIGKAHKGAIVTMDDRKSKIRLALPVIQKKASLVSEAIINLLTPIKEQVHTLTFDNGKEFTQHENISKKLECRSYFAKPYHSWERGQNENANGLLRQYFPKQMPLDKVSVSEVEIAVNKLNHRPRKCLNFKTPYEVFLKLTGIDLTKKVGVALMS